MKKNKRKLTLGKETLQRVTGGGPLSIVSRFCTFVATCAGCPVGTHNNCSFITCGQPNTCAPWGCESDLITCKCG